MRLKAGNNRALIHHQIFEMVDQNSKVVEFGCAKGDLLLNLCSKIEFGIGIDNSKTLIDKAIVRRNIKGVSNISFSCEELNKNYTINGTYDIAIASLFFHVIPVIDSINLVNKLKASSSLLLIAAICKPANMIQSSMLWLDQKMTQHYSNFKTYKDFGYMDGLLEKVQVSDIKIFKTCIPFVRIYKIR